MTLELPVALVAKFIAAFGAEAAILWLVTSDPWDALAAPFAPTELAWRLVKLSPDNLSAQVRPQLPLAAVTRRLDDVLGRGGWSYSFGALGERGLSCTLWIGEVHRAAVVAYRGTQDAATQDGPTPDVAETAEDALVAAAACFGLRPSVVLGELPWVDYDPEQGQPLYDPDLSGLESDPLEATSESLPSVPPPTEPLPAEPFAAAPSSPPAPEEKPKSAGQQAIDKLLERLRAEGKGLEAAKLLNAYGGYGSDVQAARELYAKLRALLLEGSAP